MSDKRVFRKEFLQILSENKVVQISNLDKTFRPTFSCLG